MTSFVVHFRVLETVELIIVVKKTIFFSVFILFIQEFALTWRGKKQFFTENVSNFKVLGFVYVPEKHPIVQSKFLFLWKWGLKFSNKKKWIFRGKKTKEKRQTIRRSLVTTQILTCFAHKGTCFNKQANLYWPPDVEQCEIQKKL